MYFLILTSWGGGCEKIRGEEKREKAREEKILEKSKMLISQEINDKSITEEIN